MHNSDSNYIKNSPAFLNQICAELQFGSETHASGRSMCNRLYGPELAKHLCSDCFLLLQFSDQKLQYASDHPAYGITIHRTL